ncbi:MAG: hypothetical protein J7K69_06310 [Thermotogae bacterium]|nr:hypothetical protein [Thermotogota bacterium]
MYLNQLPSSGLHNGQYVQNNVERSIKYLESKLMFLLARASINGDTDTVKLLKRIRNMIYSGNVRAAEKLMNEAERRLYFSVDNNKKHRKTVDDFPSKVDDSDTEQKITLVDGSNDPAVSFKYPASVPADSSFLFIASHERQHVQDIVGRAILEGKIAQVYVRYFTSYDSHGRLIFVGGYTWGKITDYRV